MKLFNRNKIPFDTKHVVELAFTVGGVDYFSFVDTLNTPYERALSALIYYKEISMNCDHEFLEQHTQAIDKVMNANPINIYQIKQLNDLLKQRLALPKDPELLWKLASVIYFDKNESPYVYDFEYSKKKIVHWKQHSQTKDFFLQHQLTELIPYLKYAGESLDQYSMMTEEFKKKHLDVVSAITSGS
jgi:hypothetical protein